MINAIQSRPPALAGNRQSVRSARSLIAAAFAALASAACRAPAAHASRPPTAVVVTTVQRASLPYTIDANGTVVPLESANVASQVDGIVQAVLFQEGQEVEKGQVLFRIDARTYEAAVRQATAVLARDRATMDNAVAEAQRYAALAHDKVVTEEQYEALRAAAAAASAVVAADSATLSNARLQLENTTVRAPIAGRTGGLLVRLGNLVRAGAGTPLVVINQVRPIVVRFAVPGSQLPLILHYGGRNAALPVTVTPTMAGMTPMPPAAPEPPSAMDAPSGTRASHPVTLGIAPADPPSTGSLYFIDNTVDTTTGTIQLKARFANRSGMLWAGQFVTASLRLFVEDSALVVPAQAVIAGQQGTYVYVVDSTNRALQRPVSVERTVNGLSVVASGLADGDRVVTDGQGRLANGANVTIRGPADTIGDAGVPGTAPGGRGARGGARRAPAGQGRRGGTSSGDGTR